MLFFDNILKRLLVEGEVSSQPSRLSIHIFQYLQLPKFSGADADTPPLQEVGRVLRHTQYPARMRPFVVPASTSGEPPEIVN